LVELLAKADRSKSDTRGKQIAHTPIGLLSVFKRHLIKDEPQLNFNMIGFSQQCSLFVEEVRKQTGGNMKRDISDLSPLSVTNFVLAQSASDLSIGMPVSRTLLPVVWKAFEDALTVSRDEFSKEAYESSSGHLSPDHKPDLPTEPASAPTDRVFNAFVRECLSKSQNWIPEDDTPNATIFQVTGGEAERSLILTVYKSLQDWEQTYTSDDPNKQLPQLVASMTGEMRAWAKADFDDAAAQKGLVDILAKSFVKEDGDEFEIARDILTMAVKGPYFEIDMALGNFDAQTNQERV